MKKKLMCSTLILLIIIGTATIIFLIQKYSINHDLHDKITVAARTVLHKAIPDADIQEIMVEKTNEYVNYVHDVLYRVEVMYRKNNKFKKIAFYIGTHKGQIIVPGELEVLSLDKEAMVILDYRN